MSEVELLASKTCKSCEGGMPPLPGAEVTRLLSQMEGWEANDAQTTITKVYNFKGFYKTMAFVNAIAWIANQEGHHPDMEVSFNKCVVHFTTHAIDGLSENDFICAAKVDLLKA